MTVRPSCGKYGVVQDLSTGDFVECYQCGRRFVGGDFTSRLRRWQEHAEGSACYSAKARGDVSS